MSIYQTTKINDTVATPPPSDEDMNSYNNDDYNNYASPTHSVRREHSDIRQYDNSDSPGSNPRNAYNGGFPDAGVELDQNSSLRNGLMLDRDRFRQNTDPRHYVNAGNARNVTGGYTGLRLESDQNISCNGRNDGRYVASYRSEQIIHYGDSTASESRIAHLNLQGQHGVGLTGARSWRLLNMLDDVVEDNRTIGEQWVLWIGGTDFSPRYRRPLSVRKSFTNWKKIILRLNNSINLTAVVAVIGRGDVRPARTRSLNSRIDELCSNWGIPFYAWNQDDVVSNTDCFHPQMDSMINMVERIIYDINGRRW